MAFVPFLRKSGFFIVDSSRPQEELASRTIHGSKDKFCVCFSFFWINRRTNFVFVFIPIEFLQTFYFIYIEDYELSLNKNEGEAQVILSNNMHLKISSIILLRLKVFKQASMVKKPSSVTDNASSVAWHLLKLQVNYLKNSKLGVQEYKVSIWFIEKHIPAIGILIEKYFSRMHRPNPLNYPRSRHKFTTLN